MSLEKAKMREKALHKAGISSADPFIKAFYHSAVAAMIVSLADRSIIDVNESFLNIFEYAREEVIGSSALKLNLYYDPADSVAIFQILGEQGAIRDYEYTGRTKTGRIVKVLFSADIVTIQGKDYIIISGMDITDRKRAEEKLKESEAMLARAQEMAHIGHWERDLLSQKSRWSDETYRIFGFEPQACEVAGRFFFDHILTEDLVRMERAIHDAIEKGAPLNEAFRIVRPDGTIRWVRGKGEVTRDEDGTPQRIFGTILDVTERKEADEKLKESEEKYRALVEQADDGIIIVQDAILKYVNPRMADLLGSTAEQLTGSPIADYIDPADVEKVTEMHRRRIGGEKFPAIYEALLKGQDGRSIQTELNVGVITYHGKPATQVTIRDITEHKRMEEALRSSEEAAMVILNATQETIFLIDISGVILSSNTAAARRLGAEPNEIIGRCIYDLLPGDVARTRRAAGKEVIRTGRPTTLQDERMGRYFDSLIYPVFDESGQVTRLVIYAQDVTGRKRMEEDLRKSRDELERRVQERTEELQKAYDRLLSEIKQRHQAEEQLLQSQKMEAVGNLAGGIAHDFNNMLAVIIGNAELALDDIEGPPRHFLKQILNASERSRDLVRQILTFTRKNEGPREVMRLTPLLKETVKLLRGSLPSTIHIRLAIRTDTDTLFANPSQMQQVIMNLATNAAYAMEHGGTLAIRLSKTTFEEGDRFPDNDMHSGGYLKLTMRDTGTGIPEDIRQRIFEPFFTTKDPGKGTGMGLAVAFGIVKSHEGAVTVASKMGKGSVFSVYLPIARDAIREEPVQSWRLPRGKERILVVDDEPLVVEMTSETLKRLGYRVTPANSGSEGWIQFEHDPYRFDLVITDHVMPEITGMRLAERMLELRGDLPIILCTGYSEMVSAEKAKAAGIREFLMKPLMIQELAYIVRRVLDIRKY
ncbi:MAG: hybrid sensor histidine kinase/response regulator [Syntrophorhabdaceae bacterium]